MKRLGVITAAVLSLLLGAPAFAYASQEQQGGKQKQEQQDKKHHLLSAEPPGRDSA
jgi:hypothetical protein